MTVLSSMIFGFSGFLETCQVSHFPLYRHQIRLAISFRSSYHPCPYVVSFSSYCRMPVLSCRIFGFSGFLAECPVFHFPLYRHQIRLAITFRSSYHPCPYVVSFSSYCRMTVLSYMIFGFSGFLAECQVSQFPLYRHHNRLAITFRLSYDSCP